MDLILVDQIMLGSLRNAGHTLPAQVEAYLKQIQTPFYCHHISPNTEKNSNLMVYTFLKKNSDAHRSFYEICEQVLAFVIREKIKRVFLVAPAAYAQILVHDLTNVGAEVFILNDKPGLSSWEQTEKSFSGSLTPLFFQHSEDYLNSIPKKIENDLFAKLIPLIKPFRASTQEQNSDYVIIAPDNEVVKINFSGIIDHSADVLVFTQKIDNGLTEYPCCVNSDQDYSYLLYRPIIQSECHFMVKKSFLERISVIDKELLHKDPNWVFYKYNAHVVGTLLKTKSSPLKVQDDESAIDEFERLYFHRSLSLYKQTMVLNKTKRPKL